MKIGSKIAIVVLLAVAVAATFALRGSKRATPEPPAAAAAPKVVAAAARPRLLEVGSTNCMACVEMAKVLDALRVSQGVRLQVDFVDIYRQPEIADRHKVTMIPTQILFDAAGKEIFRHTGYFAHNDILAKFRDLGVRL